MIRITMSTRSDNAARYFDGQDARERNAIITEGRWGGKGAARLGLGVQVTRRQFVALGLNREPGTGKRLTIRLKKKRTAGYDMCFSVPKSVSLYLSETQDPVVEKLILESFRETMADMESNMETRVRVNNRDENRTTGNMIHARFIHREARPVNGIRDPHYHIHCYVFNATFDEKENRWKAGQFRNLKSDALTYELAFKYRLANRMIAAGYGIRKSGDRFDNFELASVSPDLVQKFSKRGTLIKEIIERDKDKLEKSAQLLSNGHKSFDKALAEIKGEVASRIRDKKDETLFSPLEQLVHWRAQMTPEERKSLQTDTVKAVRSEPFLDVAMEIVRAYRRKAHKPHINWAKRVKDYNREQEHFEER